MKIEIETIREAVEKGGSPEEIVESVLGQNNVTSGGKVTVVSDPSYPYEGIVGQVKGAPDGGYVDVEFPSGQTVKLAVNQLIPV
jgi:hypothetical protein